MIIAWQERNEPCAPARSATNALATHRTVSVGPMHVPGNLLLAPRMDGLVLLVRCAGGLRCQHANGIVAETFLRHRLGTLSVNLLTDDEAQDESRRLDLALLTQRVGMVLQWIVEQPPLARYPRALFGAGTGGAALLQAAATAPGRIDAVVTRGARLDLAWSSLSSVRAPTLLIAGSEVARELELHSAALREMHCEKRLEVIPGATRVFQDSGVCDTVAELSAWWLAAHLGRGATL